jgi:hypothetical protein
MEGLIELVAASFARHSFARHGIECPAADSHLARPVQTTSAQPKRIETKSAEAVRRAEPTFTAALPEHNYRKSVLSGQTP